MADDFRLGDGQWAALEAGLYSRGNSPTAWGLPDTRRWPFATLRAKPAPAMFKMLSRLHGLPGPAMAGPLELHLPRLTRPENFGGALFRRAGPWFRCGVRGPRGPDGFSREIPALPAPSPDSKARRAPNHLDHILPPH